MRSKYFEKHWIGQQFGRLCVMSYSAKNRRGQRIPMWVCKCECGKVVVTEAYDVLRGHTVSCGCLHSEVMADVSRTYRKTHGETNTRLYVIWRGMRMRCHNPTNVNYPNYGGRGITICAEWDESYGAFRDWSLSHGYADDLSIDRIDNDGGYSPNNCRWVGWDIQASNRRKRGT